MKEFNSLNKLLEYLEDNNFEYKIKISLLNKILKFLGFNYKIDIYANNGIFKNDLHFICRLPEFELITI